MDKITSYKKLGAATDTETSNVTEMSAKTGNVYETAMIIAKRADQIAVDLKSELSEKLEVFACAQDNLDEVFEDKEQIELSKAYERVPKPTLLALKEFADDRINFHDAMDAAEGTTEGATEQK